VNNTVDESLEAQSASETIGSLKSSDVQRICVRASQALQDEGVELDSTYDFVAPLADSRPRDEEFHVKRFLEYD
jgi:hypothetical protein